MPTGMLAKKTLTDMAKSITGRGGDANPMPEELELMHTKKIMVLSMLKSSPIELLFIFAKG
ncbi:MAG: hypothetical protein ACJ70X_02165 [Nitrososphaera sp.]